MDNRTTAQLAALASVAALALAATALGFELAASDAGTTADRLASCRAAQPVHLAKAAIPGHPDGDQWSYGLAPFPAASLAQAGVSWLVTVDPGCVQRITGATPRGTFGMDGHLDPGYHP